MKHNLASDILVPSWRHGGRGPRLPKQACLIYLSTRWDAIQACTESVDSQLEADKSKQYLDMYAGLL